MNQASDKLPNISLTNPFCSTLCQEIMNENIPVPKHQRCFMRDDCLQTDLCPMVLMQRLLSGKRKILILWLLSSHTMRFNEIKRKMPDVTQKMLTKQLRSLEEDLLIERHVYASIPPRVEYKLSSLGEQIIPVLKIMHNFGSLYLRETFPQLVAQAEEARAAQAGEQSK